ncbi:MAG: ABC transporter substrate-binding protein, partial [Bryobacterales bacterium]|nr:ABC transporter substrate-binding protein [Bryobacterales bacterium]
VVAHGVPVIVGAGYDAASDSVVPESSCDDNNVSARAIRTRRDVQAFVGGAAEDVQTHGPEEARRAFHQEDRWRHGPYYVFVDLIAQPHERPLSHIAVFPPNPSWEGTSQILVDNFGTDYFDELHRVMTFGDSGWLHYAFTNFVTGRSEPKSSYVVEVDWEGHRAVVGTGVYLRDLPGTCESEEVNAAGLAADPSDERLQELVRCAALEMESKGFFAKATLASDPRWNSGSVYVFGLDTHGSTLFSAQSSMGASEVSPASDESFGGRDFVSTANTFGEAFLYYSTRNPSTDMQERKVTLVKRAMVQGLPVLVGAGYYPDHRAVTGPPGGGPGGGQDPGGGNGGSAGQGDTATLLYWQAPTILNPYLSRGTKEAEAASLVLEPLAEYNPDGVLVAALATRIPTLANDGVSEDRTRITWTLREDVTWSDGTPLTADDVVFTWQYCTAPGGGCAQAARFENVASVEAVDEHTVTVVFTGPVSFPYAAFVSSSSPILQASQFSGCLGTAAAGCTDANHGPVGTGPYVVAGFHSNESVRYQFNPQYRGIAAGQPYFREVVLQGGGDAVAAARSVLELNEADYAWNLQIEPEILNSLEAGGGGTVVSAFATSVERLLLNQTNPDPSLGDL